MIRSKGHRPWVIEVIAVLVWACILSLPRASFALEGLGDANDPYRIATVEDLLSIGLDPNLWDRHFVLVADIQMDRVLGQALVGGIFRGVFDGSGHSIGRLTIDAPGKGYVGLFGQIGPEGIVKDLVLEDCNVVAGSFAGILAGSSEGRVIRCYCDGQVKGYEYVGGLIGQDKGQVQLCQVWGKVEGGEIIGGLIGRSEGKVDRCSFVGQVYGTEGVGGLIGAGLGQVVSSQASALVYGDRYTAGLIGIQAGLVDYCSASGLVSGGYGVGGIAGSLTGAIGCSWSSGQIEGIDAVGGLVGLGFGLVERSFSTGSVYGQEDVGGLIGYSQCQVSNCYSHAHVIADRSVGGLIGRQFDGKISFSYAAGYVDGLLAVGGLIGQVYEGSTYLSYWDIQATGQKASAAGRGRTTSQMKAIQTYLGWPAGNWVIEEGQGYPRLIWEGSRGQVIEDRPDLYPSGSGTRQDPYRIDTVQQIVSLGYMKSYWDRHFILEVDLDLSNIDPCQIWPIGIEGDGFRGVFDGSGHRIVGLGITGGGNYQGLFGLIDADGLVKGLSLEDSRVVGNRYIGLLAGCNKGTIQCCKATGLVQGQDTVGGLVGHNEGLIKASLAHVEIEASRFAGGLVGVSKGHIEQSYSQGRLQIADLSAGGLIGANMGDISQSYADSYLAGPASYVGGLCGVNWGWIEDSYSVGHNLCTGDHIGGLVGSLEQGTIEGSYSAVGVVGWRIYVGGLVGWSYSLDAVLLSFWDIEASSQLASYGGTGLPTVQMYSLQTYQQAGWAIDYRSECQGPDYIWTIEHGKAYPKLCWQTDSCTCK